MLAATPLNAETSERSHFGRVAVAAAYARSVPKMTPSSAVTMETFNEVVKAARSLLMASLMPVHVKLPSLAMNALRITP